VLDAEVFDPALVARATTLAQNHQARLTFCVALAPLGAVDRFPILREFSAGLRESLSGRLESLRAARSDAMVVDTRILWGEPWLEIVRCVLREGIDLVVKAAEGGQRKRQLLGSNDLNLLRKCPCPAWIVKPGQSDRCRRIIAGVDLSCERIGVADPVRRALDGEVLAMAAAIATAEFAELHVVHAWEAPFESSLRSGLAARPAGEVAHYVDQIRHERTVAMGEVMAALRARIGEEAFGYLQPRCHLVKGSPRTRIPALARRLDADLLVMGTVGRTGVAGVVIGNTAEAILREIDIAVLAIKPSGFVSPVQA
jgi:nucleotide-binding universal stress UspA family protein